ncbi:hypothetical protein ACSU1N_01660 [Thermogladius sp. 4427co]|uniref:hypothetical protein n=1 Tax=Thermogladius sp. 4427co TaxID=3450718 RepID=UPI003F7933D6
MPDRKKIVLDTLREYGELNITKLSRLTGIHFRALEKILLELSEQGLVEEKRYGRLRLIRVKTS